jgi:hypothetical protein
VQSAGEATPLGPDLLLTSVHVGALGIELPGDTTVSTVLLGADLPFVTPGKNTVAGVGGGAVGVRGAGVYRAVGGRVPTFGRCRHRCRSMNRCTLPLGVFGSSERNSISRG